MFVAEKMLLLLVISLTDYMLMISEINLEEYHQRYVHIQNNHLPNTIWRILVLKRLKNLLTQMNSLSRFEMMGP